MFKLLRHFDQADPFAGGVEKPEKKDLPEALTQLRGALDKEVVSDLQGLKTDIELQSALEKIAAQEDDESSAELKAAFEAVRGSLDPAMERETLRKILVEKGFPDASSEMMLDMLLGSEATETSQRLRDTLELMFADEAFKQEIQRQLESADPKYRQDIFAFLVTREVVVRDPEGAEAALAETRDTFPTQSLLHTVMEFFGKQVLDPKRKKDFFTEEGKCRAGAVFDALFLKPAQGPNFNFKANEEFNVFSRDIIDGEKISAKAGKAYDNASFEAMAKSLEDQDRQLSQPERIMYALGLSQDFSLESVQAKKVEFIRLVDGMAQEEIQKYVPNNDKVIHDEVLGIGFEAGVKFEDRLTVARRIESIPAAYWGTVLGDEYQKASTNLDFETWKKTHKKESPLKALWYQIKGMVARLDKAFGGMLAKFGLTDLFQIEEENPYLNQELADVLERADDPEAIADFEREQREKMQEQRASAAAQRAKEAAKADKIGMKDLEVVSTLRGEYLDHWEALEAYFDNGKSAWGTLMREPGLTVDTLVRVYGYVRAHDIELVERPVRASDGRWETPFICRILGQERTIEATQIVENGVGALAQIEYVVTEAATETDPESVPQQALEGLKVAASQPEAPYEEDIVLEKMDEKGNPVRRTDGTPALQTNMSPEALTPNETNRDTATEMAIYRVFLPHETWDYIRELEEQGKKSPIRVEKVQVGKGYEARLHIRLEGDREEHVPWKVVQEHGKDKATLEAFIKARQERGKKEWEKIETVANIAQSLEAPFERVGAGVFKVGDITLKPSKEGDYGLFVGDLKKLSLPRQSQAIGMASIIHKARTKLSEHEQIHGYNKFHKEGSTLEYDDGVFSDTVVLNVMEMAAYQAAAQKAGTKAFSLEFIAQSLNDYFPPYQVDDPYSFVEDGNYTGVQ